MDSWQLTPVVATYTLAIIHIQSGSADSMHSTPQVQHVAKPTADPLTTNTTSCAASTRYDSSSYSQNDERSLVATRYQAPCLDSPLTASHQRLNTVWPQPREPLPSRVVNADLSSPQPREPLPSRVQCGPLHNTTARNPGNLCPAGLNADLDRVLDMRPSFFFFFFFFFLHFYGGLRIVD